LKNGHGRQSRPDYNARYLLCRGIQKASGEMGLSFLVYNLRRALNLVGAKALIAAMKIFRPVANALQTEGRFCLLIK